MSDHYPGLNPVCTHCGRLVIADLTARAEAAEAEARRVTLDWIEMKAQRDEARAEVERLTRECATAESRERLASSAARVAEAREAEARRLLEQALGYMGGHYGECAAWLGGVPGVLGPSGVDESRCDCDLGVLPRQIRAWLEVGK